MLEALAGEEELPMPGDPDEMDIPPQAADPEESGAEAGMPEPVRPTAVRPHSPRSCAT